MMIAMKQILFNLCSAALLSVVSASSSEHEKVNVTVYYETKCPDCMKFFTGELNQTFYKLYDYLNVELVPYGKANQSYIDGQWHFNCQHGELECKYNKMHACHIHRYKLDPEVMVDFLICLMTDSDEDKILQKCSDMFAIDVDDIKACVKSHGDELLSGMGNRTHDFSPDIPFVPTIVYNSKFNQKDQDESLKNMMDVACRYLKNKPKKCLADS